MMRRFIFPLLLLFLAALLCFSCSLLEGRKPAILWTDQSEFAFYGEQFNAAQDQYRVAIRYFDSPAQKLADTGEHPDIVVGRWLKSASTRVFFKSQDSFLNGRRYGQNDFYSRLLAMGKIDGRQYLLPVSFNAPALVFARDKGELLSNPFTIGFDEMRRLGKSYNIEKNGVYTRMGFSPAWDDNFLFIVAALFNVSFREAAPLAWDSAALEQAMNFVQTWTVEVNTGNQAVEDFHFKYFYEPPVKLAASGRILFAYMGSGDLFTQAEELRDSL
ncbi:MAG: hypothetical protein LBD48_07900, partial [Treponema sp.]|nr:hypothetical protein [Treponema sp.]